MSLSLRGASETWGVCGSYSIRAHTATNLLLGVAHYNVLHCTDGVPGLVETIPKLLDLRTLSIMPCSNSDRKFGRANSTTLRLATACRQLREFRWCLLDNNLMDSKVILDTASHSLKNVCKQYVASFGGVREACAGPCVHGSVLFGSVSF